MIYKSHFFGVSLLIKALDLVLQERSKGKVNLSDSHVRQLNSIMEALLDDSCISVQFHK